MGGAGIIGRDRVKGREEPARVNAHTASAPGRVDGAWARSAARAPARHEVLLPAAVAVPDEEKDVIRCSGRAFLPPG